MNVHLIVNERLKGKGIRLNDKKGFTTTVLTAIVNFYDVKNEEKYAFRHIVGSRDYYTYSNTFVEFIVEVLFATNIANHFSY